MCEIRRWWSHDESSRVGNLLYLRMRYIRSGLVLIRMNLVFHLSKVLKKSCFLGCSRWQECHSCYFLVLNLEVDD